MLKCLQLNFGVIRIYLDYGNRIFIDTHRLID